MIFNVVLLLLTTTGSTEYISSGKSVWEISDIPDHVRQEIKDDVFRTGNSATMGGEGFRFKNKQRDLMGRNLRVPFIIAFRLRQAITAWRDPDVKQKPNRPLQAHEERIILVHVGDYMTAFYGLRKFIFAPVSMNNILCCFIILHNFLSHHVLMFFVFVIDPIPFASND